MQSSAQRGLSGLTIPTAARSQVVVVVVKGDPYFSLLPPQKVRTHVRLRALHSHECMERLHDQLAPLYTMVRDDKGCVGYVVEILEKTLSL